MVDGDTGRLSRIFNVGRAIGTAFLDDHAALLDANLDLTLLIVWTLAIIGILASLMINWNSLKTEPEKVSSSN